jgi:hypothetical protein
MKIRQQRFDIQAKPVILMLVVLGLVFAGAPDALPAQVEASSGPWLGPDDQPLPFTSARDLLEFLTTAPVVETKVLSGGINKPVRLTLERGDLRVRAIFRTVDVSRTSNHTAIERQYPSFRDRYIYEVAAYEMSRLLGINNVPPAALYEWQGQQGSIQLWVENATSEAQRIERGEAPADVARWHRQRLDMLVFDNLIFNFDRNHGNQLLDANGKLWFIDHTRAFKRTPSLPSRKDLLVIDSDLWLQLKGLDPDRVRERLSPYLNVVEVKALLKRRQILVRHVDRMIAQRGERQVLINLDPAPDQSAARTAL